MSDVVDSEQIGAVRVIRLNRPERKNALTTELGWAIIEAVRAAAADDDVRAVGITGNGDAFCSGLDFGDSSEPASPLDGTARLTDDLGWVGRFPVTLRHECEKPVVAGINGIAIGAGLSLAMAADMRVMSDGARLHSGYSRAGTSPDGGLSYTVTQLLGPERTLRFLLDPRFVDATEAATLGLVGEVAPADDFDAVFLARLEQLASVAPIAARQSKRLVHRAAETTDLEAHLRNELSYVHRGLDSEDGREAVQAIMEKRTPSFKGR